MTIKRIEIPKELNEDEFVEFVRDEVRKVGGDPDTLYIESLLEAEPVPFEVQCNIKYGKDADPKYDLKIPLEEVNNWDPNYLRIKDTLDKWKDMVMGTQNVR